MPEFTNELVLKKSPKIEVTEINPKFNEGEGIKVNLEEKDSKPTTEELNNKKLTSLSKRIDNLNNIENVRKELGLAELKKETTDIIARQKMKIQEELTGMNQQTTETKNSQKNAEKIFDNPEDDPRFKEIDKEITSLVKGKIGPYDNLNTQMAIRTNAKISAYSQFYRENLKDAEKYIKLGDDKYKNTDLFPSWYAGLKEAKRRAEAGNIFKLLQENHGVKYGSTLKIGGELWEVTDAKNIGIELKSKKKDNWGNTFTRTIYSDQFEGFLEELKQSETLLEEVRKGETENINPEILESNERVPIESKEEALSDNPLVIEKKVEDTSTNADQLGNDILLEPNQNPLRKVERKEAVPFDIKKVYKALENVLTVFYRRAMRLSRFDIMPQQSFDSLVDLYNFMQEKIIGKDPNEVPDKVNLDLTNPDEVNKEMVERFYNAMGSLQIADPNEWHSLDDQVLGAYRNDMQDMRQVMVEFSQELRPFAEALQKGTYSDAAGAIDTAAGRTYDFAGLFDAKVQHARSL